MTDGALQPQENYVATPPPAFPQGGTEKGSIFVDRSSGQPLKIYLDTSLPGRFQLVRHVINAGGDLAVDPTDPSVSFLVLDASDKHIFDEYCHPVWLTKRRKRNVIASIIRGEPQIQRWKTKVLLRAQWIVDCVEEGMFLGEDYGWVDMRVGGPPMHVQLFNIWEYPDHIETACADCGAAFGSVWDLEFHLTYKPHVSTGSMTTAHVLVEPSAPQSSGENAQPTIVPANQDIADPEPLAEVSATQDVQETDEVDMEMDVDDETPSQTPNKSKSPPPAATASPTAKAVSQPIAPKVSPPADTSDTLPVAGPSQARVASPTSVFRGMHFWIDDQMDATRRQELCTSIEQAHGTVHSEDFGPATHILVESYEPAMTPLVEAWAGEGDGKWVLYTHWATDCMRAGQLKDETEFAVPGGVLRGGHRSNAESPKLEPNGAATNGLETGAVTNRNVSSDAITSGMPSNDAVANHTIQVHPLPQPTSTSPSVPPFAKTEQGTPERTIPASPKVDDDNEEDDDINASEVDSNAPSVIDFKAERNDESDYEPSDDDDDNDDDDDDDNSDDDDDERDDDGDQLNEDAPAADLGDDPNKEYIDLSSAFGQCVKAPWKVSDIVDLIKFDYTLLCKNFLKNNHWEERVGRFMAYRYGWYTPKKWLKVLEEWESKSGKFAAVPAPVPRKKRRKARDPIKTYDVPSRQSALSKNYQTTSIPTPLLMKVFKFHYTSKQTNKGVLADRLAEDHWELARGLWVLLFDQWLNHKGQFSIYGYIIRLTNERHPRPPRQPQMKPRQYFVDIFNSEMDRFRRMHSADWLQHLVDKYGIYTSNKWWSIFTLFYHKRRQFQAYEPTSSNGDPHPQSGQATNGDPVSRPRKTRSSISNPVVPTTIDASTSYKVRGFGRYIDRPWTLAEVFDILRVEYVEACRQFAPSPLSAPWDRRVGVHLSDKYGSFSTEEWLRLLSHYEGKQGQFGVFKYKAVARKKAVKQGFQPPPAVVLAKALEYAVRRQEDGHDTEAIIDELAQLHPFYNNSKWLTLLHDWQNKSGRFSPFNMSLHQVLVTAAAKYGNRVGSGDQKGSVPSLPPMRHPLPERPRSLSTMTMRADATTNGGAAALLIQDPSSWRWEPTPVPEAGPSTQRTNPAVAATKPEGDRGTLEHATEPRGGPNTQRSVTADPVQGPSTLKRKRDLTSPQKDSTRVAKHARPAHMYASLTPDEQVAMAYYVRANPDGDKMATAYWEKFAAENTHRPAHDWAARYKTSSASIEAIEKAIPAPSKPNAAVGTATGPASSSRTPKTDQMRSTPSAAKGKRASAGSEKPTGAKAARVARGTRATPSNVEVIVIDSDDDEPPVSQRSTPRTSVSTRSRSQSARCAATGAKDDPVLID